MAKDKYNQYFEFPQGVLNQIDECSPTGFMLFYIDNTGNAQVKIQFDSQIVEMGLRNFATKILEGIDNVENEEIAQSIFKKLFNPEDEGIE